MLRKLITKTFRSDSAIAGMIGLYSAIGAQYLLYVMLAKLLTVDAYGQLALAFAITGIGGVLLQFGFSHAIVKLIGVYSENHQLALLSGALKYAASLTLFGGLCVLLLGVLLSSWFLADSSYGVMVIVLSFAANVPYALLLLYQNMARGYKRMYLATLPAGVGVPLTSLGLLMVYESLQTPEMFMVVYCISVIIFCVVTFVFLGRIPGVAEARQTAPEFRKKEWQKLALPMMTTVGVNQFMQRGDVIVLAMFVTPEVTGIYALASRFAQSVTISNRAFNRLWAVDMAKTYAADDALCLQNVVHQTARWAFFVSLLFAAVLCVFGEAIFSFFGESFESAYVLMLILLLGQLTTSYFAPSVTLLQMTGHELLATKIFVWSAIVVFMAYVMTIPLFAEWAAAWVNASGIAVVYVLAALMARKYLSCKCGAVIMK